ncbi:hypothetical protein AB0L75_09660 [Streptomyces sp. NPDC052101]|uniref:hypothetical protein n=1 Tax=Streptomyces sp. NPDC052101 TaxID=3155763 RepID=UPI003438DF8D
MGMKTKVGLGAVVGIAVIAAVSANAGGNGKDGGSGGGKGSSASAEHTPGGTKDAKGPGDAQAAGKKKTALAGDGEYRIGSDMRPGTYRTSGNTDDQCYWERAKDAKGETDSTLANENVTGTGYVTVKASDKIFKSSGCKDWEAVDPAAKGTPARAMDGDGGMYKVGTDIAPGTYRSTGNKDDSCYWERTKDAEHGLDSVIANDNVTGTAVVTISPDDAYFKTSGCGNWKKAA